MRKRQSIFILCFLICSSFIHLCKSEDEEVSDEERPRSCQRYIFDFVVGILKSMTKCLGGQSSFKPNNIFEYVTRSSCLLKCTLQEEGILAEDGSLDDIGAAFYFEETFDQPVRDIALPIAQGCFGYAENFVASEYWCKSYLQFIECSFRAILKGLIPYGGDCVTNPILGILFSVLRAVAKDSPKIEEEMEELKRSVANKTKIKCMDKYCTKMYEYKKVNGTQSIVLYNQDMDVLSIENRKTKPKPKDITNPSSRNNNVLYGYR